jgi:hypothetical protein
MKTRGLIVACTWAALLAACASTVRYMPTPDVLVAVSGEDDSIAALRNGRMLAAQKCSGCHRTYWPQEYPAERWPGIITQMKGRSSLSDTNAADVARYFVLAAKYSEAQQREARANEGQAPQAMNDSQF